MKFVPSAIACLASTAFAVAPAAVAAAEFSVVIDGTAVVFDRPPFERDGRLYVPLRGIFERLGASVVHSGGRIDATSGPHTIGLHVGEPTAIIDGSAETLDAAPFVAAGRTFVPLRFISQAFGATVRYDGNTHAVAIDRATVAPPVAIAPPVAVATPTGPPSAAETARPSAPNPAGEVQVALRLIRLEPAANATLVDRWPEISATFAESVEPASVRVSLDGRDITADTAILARSFTYEPRVDVPAATHEIVIGGKTPDNESFLERWSFTTRDGTNANYISGLEPISGVTLGSTTFDVSGFTRPKSRVRLVATTNATIPTFGDPSDGATTTDAVANGKGYFETTLALADRGSGVMDVRIASTAPDGSIAVRTLRLRL